MDSLLGVCIGLTGTSIILSIGAIRSAAEARRQALRWGRVAANADARRFSIEPGRISFCDQRGYVATISATEPASDKLADIFARLKKLEDAPPFNHHI